MVLQKLVSPSNRDHVNLPLLSVSLALAAVFCALSMAVWGLRGNLLYSFEAALLALSGIGLALYAVLPRRKQPLARKLILLLGGGAGLLFALISRVSLDLEGFFLLVFCGTMGAAIGHHLITVIVGPIFFGRLWCGWGCWTAMILDLMPFSRSPGRMQGKWKFSPFVVFVVTLGIAALACLVYGYRGTATLHNSPRPSEL
jgi:ferredoxin-type protein NapH